MTAEEAYAEGVRILGGIIARRWQEKQAAAAEAAKQAEEATCQQ
jgi:hypothetical protein